jgi:heme/copper-type cytochrome/quinol oxidase subunit 3
MSSTFNKNNVKYERHPFHLVDPSPWPLLTSISVFTLVLGLLLAFNQYGSPLYMVTNFSFFFFCLYRWFLDITIEATFEGQHTSKVQSNILAGMKWFIVSEIMFFFSFFWAYFHFSLLPSTATGSIWPVYNEISPWAIPFANTAILLSSGLLATLAHWSLKHGRGNQCFKYLLEAINLGVLFTGLQVFEYGALSFSISSSAFGSVFYMVTGFHGFHVLIGTIFLLVCLIRLKKNHFLTKYHIGFVCALWYWHFVDVVWIALFWIVYVGGKFNIEYQALNLDFVLFVNFIILAYFLPGTLKSVIRHFTINPILLVTENKVTSRIKIDKHK